MTTTLTNASLSDAVALFLSNARDTISASATPLVRPVAKIALRATHPGRPALGSLFQASDPGLDEEITSAFDLLERGTV